MRRLQTKDVFKVSKIIKKMNLDFTISEGMSQHEAGTLVIKHMAENMHMAEAEITDFMADLVGMSAEDYAKLPLIDTMKYFEELKEQEDIKSFLSFAGKLNT